VKGKFVKGELLDQESSSFISGSKLVFATVKDTTLRE